LSRPTAVSPISSSASAPAKTLTARAGRFVTIFNDLGERYFSTRLWD
jgi:hypothetical protein